MESKTQQINTNVAQSIQNNENLLERSKYTFELVNHWINNADNKISVACGINTVTFGIITFLAKGVNNQIYSAMNSSWQKAGYWMFIVSLLPMTAAIIFYTLSVMPNLISSSAEKQKNQQKQKKKYPVFFGDIAALGFSEYKELMKKGSDQELADELLLETWHNSSVCKRKMFLLKIAVVMSMIAVFIALVHLILYYIFQ